MPEVWHALQVALLSPLPEEAHVLSCSLHIPGDPQSPFPDEIGHRAFCGVASFAGGRVSSTQWDILNLSGMACDCFWRNIAASMVKRLDAELPKIDLRVSQCIRANRSQGFCQRKLETASMLLIGLMIASWPRWNQSEEVEMGLGFRQVGFACSTSKMQGEFEWSNSYFNLSIYCTSVFQDVCAIFYQGAVNQLGLAFAVHKEKPNGSPKMAIPAILEQRMRRCDLARLRLTHRDAVFLWDIQETLGKVSKSLIFIWSFALQCLFSVHMP